MRNNGNNNRMNQILPGIIVVIAALFVLSVIRMPESGGTTEDYIQDTFSTEIVESTVEDSDVASGILPEDSGESTDSPSDVSDENIDSSMEDSAEAIGAAEELPESVPETVEAILESSQAAEWADVPQQTYSFRNERLLNQHYEKHGMEMGFATIEEYVAAANAVVNHPDVLHKQEAEDNDDVYFLEATNEFVVVSTDGYIRTYFIASGGIDYYNRQ